MKSILALQEQKYIHFWQLFCNKLAWNETDLNLRFRTSLKSTENVLTFKQTYFGYTDIMHWLFFETGSDNAELDGRYLAEMICPLGFYVMVVNKRDIYFGEITATSFCSSNKGRHITVFVSSKIMPLETARARIDPVLFTKEDFFKVVCWNSRKPALLLARRARGGAFFHVLKMIAYFL
jgi:hypothetical protein